MTTEYRTIIHTIRRLMEQGYTFQQAIVRMENIDHAPIPEHIVDLLREELKP